MFLDNLDVVQRGLLELEKLCGLLEGMLAN